MVRLYYINPETNARRFYIARVEVNLFGEITLFRNWGRIGKNGRVLTQTFETKNQAQEAMNKLIARKTRKGYCGNPWTQVVTARTSSETDLVLR